MIVGWHDVRKRGRRSRCAASAAIGPCSLDKKRRGSRKDRPGGSWHGSLRLKLTDLCKYQPAAPATIQKLVNNYIRNYLVHSRLPTTYARQVGFNYLLPLIIMTLPSSPSFMLGSYPAFVMSGIPPQFSTHSSATRLPYLQRSLLKS